MSSEMSGAAVEDAAAALPDAIPDRAGLRPGADAVRQF